METTTIRISRIELHQFRSLLLDLESDRKDISIRLELNGELWTEKFSNVLVFSRQELILSHLPTRSIQYVKDVNLVTAFEIDQPYNTYEAYKHYQVNPVSQPIVTQGLRYG
jgi:hypothetical protein